MKFLEIQANLLEAIHKEIPNAKEARVVVNQYFKFSKTIIQSSTNLDLNKMEKLANDDILCDTSFSDHLFELDAAVAMSKINELCRQYHVDEMFPNVTPQSKYADISGYMNQLMYEILEHSKAEHLEYEKRMKQLN